VNAIDGVVDRVRHELGASRVTLRVDIPGRVFPVMYESLEPGIASIRDDDVPMRGQPVVEHLLAGGGQVVQPDCAAASDDPAYHEMRERFGGLAAQIVTPVRGADGTLLAILSVHDLHGPREWSDDDTSLADRAVDEIAGLMETP